ncbi:MAG: ATP-binding protein [Cyanobacteria bacterium P01_A01_bin.83]
MLNKLNPRRSLQARLFWNTTVMVLVLSLVLSLLVGYVSGTRIESTRGQSLDLLAAQMADKLEEGLFERYKDIQVLSTLSSIRQPTSSFAVTRTLLEKLQKLYPNYSWIGLTDTQGNVLASTGGLLEGKNASQRPWFQQAQTKPYVGDVHDALLLAKLLQIINDSGEHLLELINDILDMSKIEAGKITLQETDFSLTGLLDDLEAMFTLQAKSNGLQLNFVTHDLPQYIKSDRQKLRQILINLLSNAIKFTEVGSITLSATKISEDNPQLLFTVEDTGAGIANEEIANLFQPFTQAQAGYKAPEGTGLGLAISYHFAHLMQGELTVSSKLTRGSSFTLSLPLNIGAIAEEITIRESRRL